MFATKFCLPLSVLLMLTTALLALGACSDEDDEEYNYLENGILRSLPPGGGELGDLGLTLPNDYAAVAASIEDEFDADGWGFDLSNESLVVINMSATGSLNPLIQLYTLNRDPVVFMDQAYSRGQLLWEDDDDGPGTDAAFVGYLQAGRYGLLAWSSLNGPFRGGYEIHAIGAVPDGGDFGIVSAGFSDTFEMIEFIDRMDGEPDTLAYVFTLDGMGTMSAAAQAIAGNPDASLELIDQENNVLVGLTDPVGTADPSINDVLLLPGTYILYLRNAVGADLGMVNLTMQVE